MVATRYTRDEIISQGIEETGSPTLIAHDLPGGAVDPSAYAIKWLQRGLDMFHRKYPFSSDIQEISLTIRSNNSDLILTENSLLYLPSDFVLDVRDGVEVTLESGSYRLKRVGYPMYLDYRLAGRNISTNRPQCYCIVNNRLKVLPLLTESTQAILHYYYLRPALDPNDPVNFPDEETLVRYITLRGQEWSNHPRIQMGTAQEYFKKQLAGFRAAGLLNETEYEGGIPLEKRQVISDGTVSNRNDWMGPLS